MEEMPIMDPPEGDWDAIWRAADWQAKKAPERFIATVVVKRSGSILRGGISVCVS